MNQHVENSNPTYAESLEGRELKGWRVEKRLANDPNFSGGYNSISYAVKKDGQAAFMKVFDVQDVLKRAEADPDFDAAQEINKLTLRYMFERDLLRDCEALDKIINVLDSGQVFVEPGVQNSYTMFIVCELAECDIRKALGTIHPCDVSWRLTTMHQVSTGLQQLHKNQIAHNDLKQANILITRGDRKIGDLGSGTRRDMAGPNDGPIFPGDARYWPPEIVYRYHDPDWVKRHIPVDLFALGSVAAFLFTGVSMYGLMMHKHLADIHRAPFYGGSWTGSFDEVKPYLIDAYAKSLVEISESLPVPEGRFDYRPEVMQIITALTHPIPEKRGVQGSDGQPTMSLIRTVSRFNALANLALVKKGVAP